MSATRWRDRSRRPRAASSPRGSATGSSAAGRSVPTATDADVSARVVHPRSGDRRGDGRRRRRSGDRSSTRTAPGRGLGRHGRARQRRPDDRVPATGLARPARLQPGRRPDRADGRPAIVADGAVAEFDVRWDETGTWLAIWLADATDPTIGRLSLSTSTRRPASSSGRTAPRRMSRRCPASRSRTGASPGRRRPARAARAAASRSSPGPTTRSAPSRAARSRASSSSTRDAAPGGTHATESWRRRSGEGAPSTERAHSKVRERGAQAQRARRGRPGRAMVCVSCDPSGWS